MESPDSLTSCLGRTRPSKNPAGLLQCLTNHHRSQSFLMILIRPAIAWLFNSDVTYAKKSLNRRVQCAVDFVTMFFVGPGSILLSHRTSANQITWPI